jgi:hypothetical protein
VAGVALAPLAVAMMALSPRVPRLLERFGPRHVAPIGLLLMAGGFFILSTAGQGTTYWLLLTGLVPLGVGMALATTPATTAIVSSLPQAKQGVASAVNDLAREVGGALGIAVLGSALTGRYQSGVADATAHLPAQLAGHAEDALPAALAIADRLGPQGATLASSAQGRLRRRSRPGPRDRRRLGGRRSRPRLLARAARGRCHRPRAPPRLWGTVGGRVGHEKEEERSHHDGLRCRSQRGDRHRRRRASAGARVAAGGRGRARRQAAVGNPEVSSERAR